MLRFSGSRQKCRKETETIHTIISTRSICNAGIDLTDEWTQRLIWAEQKRQNPEINDRAPRYERDFRVLLIPAGKCNLNATLYLSFTWHDTCVPLPSSFTELKFGWGCNHRLQCRFILKMELTSVSLYSYWETVLIPLPGKGKGGLSLLGVTGSARFLAAPLVFAETLVGGSKAQCLPVVAPLLSKFAPPTLNGVAPMSSSRSQKAEKRC